MPSSNTIDALNRLYAMFNRSLATYLSYAPPWMNASGKEAAETLGHIVDDHKATVDRLGKTILDLGGDVDPGKFPMTFTGLHDLTIDYLIGLLIDHQKIDIAGIEECVDHLNLAPMAKAIAEETLGAAKGHLDSLEELKQPPSIS